jgi:hypothetical protein
MTVGVFESVQVVVRADVDEQDVVLGLVGNEFKQDSQVVTRAARPRAIKRPLEFVGSKRGVKTSSAICRRTRAMLAADAGSLPTTRL